MTVPAPIQAISNGTMSGVNSASGSPAPRAGFSRIGAGAPVAPSTDISPAQSQGGTPVPPDRVKVAFGLGMKRKAGEEAAGSPPAKRR